jgi:RNA polymerase sigma-70 factor (ECF subfamily)
MPFEASDRALVEQAKNGNVEAFGILHDRYYAKIYRLAYLKTGNAEDAQDIASETFCRALHHLPRYQFRRCESLYPWLHRIASNLMVDACRSRPAGGVISLDAALGEELGSFLEQLPDTGASPQDLVERKEVQALVQEAIRRLPADQSDAVSYRFLADLSIREIARALNRSEGAVKSLLHRALVSLRRDLAARLTELGLGSGATRTEGSRTSGKGSEPLFMAAGNTEASRAAWRAQTGNSGGPRSSEEAEVRNVIRIQSAE